MHRMNGGPVAVTLVFRGKLFSRVPFLNVHVNFPVHVPSSSGQYVHCAFYPANLHFEPSLHVPTWHTCIEYIVDLLDIIAKGIPHLTLHVGSNDTCAADALNNRSIRYMTLCYRI